MVFYVQLLYVQLRSRTELIIERLYKVLRDLFEYIGKLGCIIKTMGLYEVIKPKL